MNENHEIRKGDLLISHKGRYHYLVEYENGNKVGLFWLHRRAGEPAKLEIYRREINYDRAPVDYDVIPAENVKWSDYSNL